MRKFQADAFACRLLLQKAICIGGPDAPRRFYNVSYFRRAGVIPGPIRKTLLGDGGLHGLDAHRHRKQLFLSFLGPQCLDGFKEILEDRWSQAVNSWRGADIFIFDEARRTLFCAMAQWAGIPFAPDEVEVRSRDLALMVDAFGSIGPRNWRGRFARQRSEQWMKDLVRASRGGDLKPKRGAALEAITMHRELDGRLLDEHVAAVELLNVIRPMMAVSYFLELAAAALHLHPHLREGVKGGAEARERFVQEVRRFYPFTPMLAAYACTDVPWLGYVIPKGTLTVLDVYGIHHDERIWARASIFDPDRFRGWDGSPYTLIQQGGGDHDTGHRCPGEWLTIETLKITSKTLAATAYAASATNLLFDLRRIPSRLRLPVRLRC